MLFELFSDIIRVGDVLFIVKSNGATSEVRSDMLSVRQKEKWITLGDNDGPAHMHVDSEAVASAEFVREPKPGRVSYSVRFFDKDGDRVLAAFFTKMYDGSGALLPERKAVYDGLELKYSSRIEF